MSLLAAARDRRSLLAYALLGGPLWWMIHLVGASVLVPVACEHGVERLIDALTIVTAAGAALAVVVALRFQERPPAGTVASTEGARLLAFVAVAGSAISLVLILLEGAPTLVLGPCQ